MWNHWVMSRILPPTQVRKQAGCCFAGRGFPPVSFAPPFPYALLPAQLNFSSIHIKVW